MNSSLYDSFIIIIIILASVATIFNCYHLTMNLNFVLTDFLLKEIIHYNS